ncbi:MAG: hypothetical protein RML49_02620 [Verrucomicrobiae bacterium]|nr:hypothetical protein [Verrucomicrobiae bacterium]
MSDNELKKLLASLIASQKKTDQQINRLDQQISRLEETVEKTVQSVKKLEESLEKTNRKVDRLAELYGNMSNNIGEILEEKFLEALEVTKELGGMKFEQIEGRVRLPGEAEFDIVMRNGESVAAIEVKQCVRKEDVKRLAEKLPLLHKYKDFEGMRVYGGLAGERITKEAKGLAEEEGFYLIAETPKGLRLLNKPGFKPRAR